MTKTKEVRDMEVGLVDFAVTIVFVNANVSLRWFLLYPRVK